MVRERLPTFEKSWTFDWSICLRQKITILTIINCTITGCNNSSLHEFIVVVVVVKESNSPKFIYFI